ncbi:MAG: undecaprenyl/decaprenyl-phosphate alpha-N-acetylglucosaminyl 1-phosphate transferase [Firmicutes bacterium]|nr:undecaprenyl/decaprenyl-phosphate alpha-N-acetylglucosaminyl 1-phosphate transferase [Bacillota bacterium]
MIYEYIISFAVAFIVSFSATPIVRKIAIKLKAIDIPKDSRRLHKKPIALMGGLAIVCGFVISVLFTILSSLLTGNQWLESFRDIVGLLAGITIIVMVGAIDDIKPLNAKVRLLFQLLATLAVMFISDTRIERVTNPFSPVGVTELSPYVSYPLTILWIIGITNALNLIDGLDGLAAGVASISSLTLFFVSLLTPVVGPFSSIITAALAGATLGFLPFNFNPAKIFMGSTGAYFLGFTLGVVSIEGMFKSYTAISIAIPILALGLPLFDTIFAIFRRLINGKPVMCADRGHLHHRLIDMGLSQKQSVIILYIASAALGLCAVVLTDKGALSAIILLLLVSAFIIAGARYMVGLTNNNDDIDLESLNSKNPLEDKKEATANTINKGTEKSNSMTMKVLKKADNR